jgi:nitrogen fixation protein FixH
MNWGKAIVVAYIFFGAFIISMVVMTYKQNIDLVAEDYYAQELDYQAHMHKMEKLQALGGVTIKRNGQQLKITFPESLAQAEELAGTINFYRPSNAMFDSTKNFTIKKSNILELDGSQLLAGKWDVKIEFSDGTTEYFHLEKLYW